MFQCCLWLFKGYRCQQEMLEDLVPTSYDFYLCKTKDRSSWIIGSRLAAIYTGCSFSLFILYFLLYVSGHFQCHFCSYLPSFKYLAYVASSWKLAALKPNKLQNKLLYANSVSLNQVLTFHSVQSNTFSFTLLIFPQPLDAFWGNALGNSFCKPSLNEHKQVNFL